MDPIVKSLPIAQILPSPHQARKSFDTEHLRGLAESMKQEGLLNPVVVRKVQAGYELISGERRLRAAKLLGWPTLEAKVINTVSEAEAAAKGLIENIQREDLNTIEEAEGYKALNRLDPKYWTQNKIAQNCGKTQGHVSEFLRFLTLPDVVKGYIRRRILTAGHAVELLRLNTANEQKTLANKIIKGKLSVMQTREVIDRRLGKNPQPTSEVSASKKTEDPFGEIWPALLEKPELRSLGTWDISYGPRKVGEKNRPVNCWTLALPDPGTVSKNDLSRWFRSMSNALWPASKTANNPIQAAPAYLPEPTPEPEPVIETPKPRELPTPTETPAEPPPAPRISMLLPSTEDEFDVMARERTNLRLPQNTTEEAEVEALAFKGPIAVYQWIYGADSFTARKVGGRTWAEWGISDPIAGARGVIRALRKIQELSKTI